jgi:hypothetical protein
MAAAAGRRAAAWPLGLVLGTACGAPSALSRQAAPAADPGAPAAAPAQAQDPLAALRAWETATRAETDFARAQTSDVALGTDPYVIRWMRSSADRTAAGGRFVGLLRGRSAVVELDESLREVGRLGAPASPTGLAVSAGGEVFSVGELSNRVARFRQVDGRLRATGFIDLPGVRAMRDVATGPEGVVYVVEEHDGRLLTLLPGREDQTTPAARTDDVLCHGPVHVLRVARSVLVDCLLDHQVVIQTVDDRGFPVRSTAIRIARDGPIWGFDALEHDAALWLVVGAVENHPLDRTQGSFGFIDSFVVLYRIANGVATEVSEVNTSAYGVVTPKALHLTRLASGGIQVVAAAYGSGRLALIDWADDRGALPPAVRTQSIPPGSAMIEAAGDGSWLMADPLLDAWVRARPGIGDSEIVPVDDEQSRARSVDSKLGEALFFTTLMAPWNRSDGRLSRFTCETCHFEGYVDGRTHHTGRGEILATTKPLVGLFNNRPHFSRALDPDLTTMVDNEFRVAGAKSDHDPWFSVSQTDFPWIRLLGVNRPTVPPEALRRSLMSFFMDFAPRPNPSIVGRTHWNDVERAGATVFRGACESCHEARLVADDPSTRVPFEGWENLVMSRQGAIVWARAGYEKTGVTPYVNELGARVVSLRRLYKKHPYFTNGSADDLRAVLDRVGTADGQFFHEGAPEPAKRLSGAEKSSLAAFLDLL